MYILTLVIMSAIAGIFSLLTSFGVWCSSRRLLSQSKEKMEWAREHEDEWLPNTDIIVREGNLLYYYPKDRSCKYGVIVNYGLNTNGTEYGLIYKGKTVFGYRDFTLAQSMPSRVLLIDNVRVFSVGYKQVITNYGTSMEEVYKKVDEEEYYINYDGTYKQIHKDNKGRFWE